MNLIQNKQEFLKEVKIIKPLLVRFYPDFCDSLHENHPQFCEEWNFDRTKFNNALGGKVKNIGFLRSLLYHAKVYAKNRQDNLSSIVINIPQNIAICSTTA